MTKTVTTVKKVAAVGPGLLRGVYSILLDSSYPTGGETVDLTTDFDYVYGMSFISNDTLADNGYKWGCIVPAPDTAATSTNVLITCHWEKNPADAGGADIAFPEFTNTGDLSAVGQLMFIAWGA